MYRDDIDALKGIAIIAVTLFHIGLLKSGYLGVDAFFVINGFLVIPSIVKNILNRSFSYFLFLRKKFVRLSPLIVIASIVSLLLGYFLMLPDHYENLAQTVIPSNMMSENILSSITTDYWDVATGYKPLMHLWYVGILFEFYLVLPIILLFACKIAKLIKQDSYNTMISTLIIVSVLSLVLYLLPTSSAGNKFYHLPYRFFELGFGGITALTISKSGNVKKDYVIQRIASILLILILFCSAFSSSKDGVNVGVVIGRAQTTESGFTIPKTLALLSTTIITALILGCKTNGSLILKSNVLRWLGKMSYSLFIWHQVFLAFYRYSFSNDVNLLFTICFLTVILSISSLSYCYIEKKISDTRNSLIACCIGAIMVIIPAVHIYLHAGVVRDIPELGVIKGEEHRGMFGEYCDRVYQYKLFPDEDNNKPNILVEGVSFGRDFANIILESELKDSINLAYAYTWDDVDIIDKVKKSDYIFCFSAKTDVPDFVWDNIKSDCVIKGVSTKNFGECNGIIYKNRNTIDYFSQITTIEPGYIELNEDWKSQWGRKDYIDLLTPSLIDDIHVRVFSDDNRFISQDCRHLTQAGAQWYANILDWNAVMCKY